MEEEKRYKNVPDLVKHLHREGYKIEKTKVYDDIKAGLLASKKPTETEVLAYITRIELTKELADTQDMQNDKALKTKLEIKNLQIKADRNLFDFEKEKGKWIDRNDAERKRVDQWSITDLHHRQSLEECMPDFLSLVGGRASMANKAVEFLEDVWDNMMHNLTKLDSMKVVYTGEFDDKD